MAAVVAAIPRGRTLTKMEVYRASMQRTGQGDEAISTGMRTAFGTILKDLARCGGSGWHRVVNADGAFWSEAPGQASQQLARLRAEGARPRAGEVVAAWALRVACPLVGCYKPRAGVRLYADATEICSLARMDPTCVEPLSASWLKERIALSGGKHFWRSAEAKPQPPAFRAVASKPRGGGATADADAAAWQRRVDEALTPTTAQRLFRAGAAQLRGLVSQAEVADLMTFAAGATFPEVVRLAGESGACGKYCFCPQRQPAILQRLRTALYANLVAQLPHLRDKFGGTLQELEAKCKKNGQTRTANIFLAYGDGAVNLAHQDPYGDLFFPYQAMLMLSKRDEDFRGGEFFVKNLQTKRSSVVQADAGDVTVFAANDQAEAGANFKHGVRRVRRGKQGHAERFAVGLVFNLRK